MFEVSSIFFQERVEQILAQQPGTKAIIVPAYRPTCCRKNSVFTWMFNRIVDSHNVKWHILPLN